MLTNYLYKNLIWQFRQNPFGYLQTEPTSKRQFEAQMEKLANCYFPERRKIDAQETEFCLNKIALAPAKNRIFAVAKGYLARFEADYTRLKNTFNKDYMEFPSSGRYTRLESAAELIAKCTQFAVSERELKNLCDYSAYTLSLNEREERYLEAVVELYKIKFYCGVTLNCLKGDERAGAALARFLSPKPLKFDYFDNAFYRQNKHYSKSLLSVVDCLGNSLVRLNDVSTRIDQKMFIYANGRNVFDTFCKSKFGQNVSEFRSVCSSAEVDCEYFLQNDCEIRKITVKNNGATRKFAVDVTFRCTDTANTVTKFGMGNAVCLGIAGERSFYCAAAILRDNAMIESENGDMLSYEFTLRKNESVQFDVVTCYALSSEKLADTLEELTAFGGTRCPYPYDTPSLNFRTTKIALSLAPNGCKRRSAPKELTQTIAYSYQLGDDGVATFVDNGGNSTTLLNGFVFGVKGEGVYAVKYGQITQLNEQNFYIDADSLCYDKPSGKLTVSHTENLKTYAVNYSAPSKTLFYFPLEEQSRISLVNNVFCVESANRKFRVECIDKVESFTTNALECNEEKPRYKLSNDIFAGTCLAVCFASAKQCRLTVKSLDVAPKATPVIRESLVSTYLNYVNEKSAFCLKNRLKRADALTVSAICFTNPTFVKNYLSSLLKNNSATCYYDSNGNKKDFADKLALPLASAYYLSLIGNDLPAEIKSAANGIVFNEEFTGKDLCVKALFLKKAANIDGFDKVKCLVEYNKLKKIITSEPSLYSYAQAIGAVAMINPSKERLKDLCNRYEIPKNWYYVSQLENLYGLSICDGKLSVTPKVSQGVLEQFALYVKGKRIDTTFHKAAIQSMTLNGAQRFQPFYAQNLKNDDNTLEIRY